MAAAAHTLQTLLVSARVLRAALEETAEHRRALDLGQKVGTEAEADKLPAYDLAGTLGVMFEEDVERMVAYLLEGSRRAQRARRRTLAAARRRR